MLGTWFKSIFPMKCNKDNQRQPNKNCSALPTCKLSNVFSARRIKAMSKLSEFKCSWPAFLPTTHFSRHHLLELDNAVKYLSLFEINFHRTIMWTCF